MLRVYWSNHLPAITRQPRASNNGGTSDSSIRTSCRVSWQSPSASIHNSHSARLYVGMLVGPGIELGIVGPRSHAAKRNRTQTSDLRRIGMVRRNASQGAINETVVDFLILP